MALYGNNLVANPSAESGLTSWTTSGVTVVPGGVTGANCFSLATGATMQQSISASAVGKNPTQIKLGLHFVQLEEDSVRLDITINYSDGTKDALFMPSGYQLVDWFTIEELYDLPDLTNKSITSIAILITAEEPCFLDDIAVRRELTSLNTEDAYVAPSITYEDLIGLIGMPTSEYGLNPAHVKFYPNGCYNSSFEVFDGSNKPTHWDTDGVVSPDATFEETYSLKLTTGQSAEQALAESVGLYSLSKALWAERHRVAFYLKAPLGSSLLVQVLQDATPLTLYAWSVVDGIETEISGNSLLIVAGTDWHESYRTFSFESEDTATPVGLKVTNAGTNDIYLDAIVMEPDINGRFSSFYTHGPRSQASSGSASAKREATIVVASEDSLYAGSADITVPTGALDAQEDINEAFTLLPFITLYEGEVVYVEVDTNKYVEILCPNYTNSDYPAVEDYDYLALQSVDEEVNVEILLQGFGRQSYSYGEVEVVSFGLSYTTDHEYTPQVGDTIKIGYRGGRVLLREGDYHINSPVLFNRMLTTLEGMGPSTRILVSSDVEDYVGGISVREELDTEAMFLTLRNLSVIASSHIYSRYCINLDNAEYSTIQGIHAIGSVAFGASTYLRSNILDCYVVGNIEAYGQITFIIISRCKTVKGSIQSNYNWQLLTHNICDGQNDPDNDIALTNTSWCGVTANNVIKNFLGSIDVSSSHGIFVGNLVLDCGGSGLPQLDIGSNSISVLSNTIRKLNNTPTYAVSYTMGYYSPYGNSLVSNNDLAEGGVTDAIGSPLKLEEGAGNRVDYNTWQTLAPEGVQLVSSERVVGTAGTCMTMDDTYIYAIGSDPTYGSVRRIYKILKSDLSLVTSVSTGTSAYWFDGIFYDDGYLYVGYIRSAYPSTRAIRKYLASDLSYTSITASFGTYRLYGAAFGDDYLYIGAVTAQIPALRRYNKSDLSISLDSADNNYVGEILIDDPYLYVNVSNGAAIQKRLLSDLSVAATSATFSNFGAMFMSQDANYIYTVSTESSYLYKVDKATLTWTRVSFGFESADVEVEGSYIYIGHRDGHRVVAYNQSDITYASKSKHTVNNPYSFCVDATHLYVLDSSGYIYKYSLLT